MKQEDKLCFYLYLQKRLSEKKESHPEKKLSMTDARIALSYIRIPKVLMPIIIKELQRLELISVINKNNNVQIEILNPNENKKLDRLNKVYHKLGIF